MQLVLVAPVPQQKGLTFAFKIAESTEDLEKGRLIKCPLRALWGKYGVIEKGFDAKKEWSKVSEKGMVDLDGSTVVDCGHYIPEEKPEELLANVMQFFKT